MRARLPALWFSLAAIPAAAEQAAPFPPDVGAALDAAIAAEMREFDLPGAAIGIWVPGRGSHVATPGTADLATGLPRSRADAFRIGSITKTAIATVVLQLVGEGRLATDDPVARWFAAFPNADTITVDDLLRMRSGMVDAWDEAALGRYYDDPLMDVTAAEMIAATAARGADFIAPGGAARYNNINYLILDAIIAAVEGKPTPQVLEERIFAPLGMTNSLMPTGPELPGPLRGYGWNAATGRFEDKTELNPDPVGGAGAMISTLDDLRVYIEAVCTGALIAPELQAARMETAPLAGAPPFVGYGAGIARFGPFCGHDGTIMGSSSSAFHLPEAGATFIVNVNRLDADDQGWSDGLFLGLAKILFPDEVPW